MKLWTLNFLKKLCKFANRVVSLAVAGAIKWIFSHPINNAFGKRRIGEICWCCIKLHHFKIKFNK